MTDYLSLILLTMFIVGLIVHGYKNAKQRDEELLKKYGSFDKVPEEKRGNHYLG